MLLSTWPTKLGVKLRFALFNQSRSIGNNESLLSHAAHMVTSHEGNYPINQDYHSHQSWPRIFYVKVNFHWKHLSSYVFDICGVWNCLRPIIIVCGQVKLFAAKCNNFFFLKDGLPWVYHSLGRPLLFVWLLPWVILSRDAL